MVMQVKEVECIHVESHYERGITGVIAVKRLLNAHAQTQLPETTSCGFRMILTNDSAWPYMNINAYAVEDVTTPPVSFVDTPAMRLNCVVMWKST